DNCTTPVASYELTGATTGSGSGSDASSLVFNPGVTTVTYTLDDGNGNTTQYAFTATYQVVEDIVVTVDAGTLTCENTGSYQWINCADNSIIVGETASTFSPFDAGDYAVILTRGGCSDTSDCFTMDYTGIDTDRSQEYKVYPNPAREYVSIDMVNEQTNVTIRMFDMTGQLIYEEELERVVQTQLDVSRYKAGIYMIQIHSDQMNSIARVIKE
ncbi:MAG: T9SS type A sorting domain-containing protein, partial [Bacteroidota bacterium]|nr:T9SS type A sorting domain-containing protein [Bacteroidota bacterium]